MSIFWKPCSCGSMVMKVYADLRGFRKCSETSCNISECMIFSHNFPTQFGTSQGYTQSICIVTNLFCCGKRLCETQFSWSVSCSPPIGYPTSYQCAIMRCCHILSSVDTGACIMCTYKFINTFVLTISTNKNVLSDSRVKTEMMLQLRSEVLCSQIVIMYRVGWAHLGYTIIFWCSLWYQELHIKNGLSPTALEALYLPGFRLFVRAQPMCR